MQGQRNSVTSFPENLSFDHGSTSSDAAMDSQLSWTSVPTSTENRALGYRISSSQTNSQYLGEWSLGESSSGTAQSQSNHSERKREHAWSIHSRAALNLERQHESSNFISLDSVDVDRHGNQTANFSSVLQTSSPSVLPQDLNMRSEFQDNDDDERQVVEHPSTCISVRSANEQMPCTGMEDIDYRPGCSLDGRRISCKRKAIEVHVGQSSGAGSSDCFGHDERSQWHGLPAAQNSSSNVSTSTRAEHSLDISNGLELTNSGIRLGNPFSLSSRGTAESSRRNFGFRINCSPQQDHASGTPFSTEENVGNLDVSSSQHSSRLVLHSRLLDINPSPAPENGGHRTVLPHIPSARRNHQSRWSEAPTSRTSNLAASAMLYEEFTSGSIPRSISEHPMFVPASELAPQQPTNWNMADGSSTIVGNIPSSSSQSGSASGVSSSSPSWARRSYPQYPRRLSEIVQRSLLSSAGAESVGPSSNIAIRSSSLSTSQEIPFSSGSSSHGHRVSNSRSALLERHLDGALGIHNSIRSLAAAGEGRSGMVSEQIRHVLDLMRRGEGLRIEDMMILDQSVFYGMANIFDRHRGMRMDVDNMSYEQLLALGERIGNVSTGLDEEAISLSLKQQKYPTQRAKDEAEIEPCSICREEYDNGEDLGVLDCGHDFHSHCIKQWLLRKNLCPICKMTGLSK